MLAAIENLPESLIWIKEIGGLILSWPMIALVGIILLYRPLRYFLFRAFEQKSIWQDCDEDLSTSTPYRDSTQLEVGNFLKIKHEVESLKKREDKLSNRIVEQEAKIDKQSDMIMKLVVYSMSEAIYCHLRKIYKKEQLIYSNEDWMRAQMYYLSDNGYIQSINDSNLSFGHSMNGQDLCSHLKLTPAGEFLVELREMMAGK